MLSLCLRGGGGGGGGGGGAAGTLNTSPIDIISRLTKHTYSYNLHVKRYSIHMKKNIS